MKSEGFVEIGEILKPHGIKGELVATIDRNVKLTELQWILLCIDGLMVPFNITACRQRSSESVLLTLDGINDERDAAELAHHTIMVPHGTAAVYDDEDDSLSAGDLVGYTIYDEDGTDEGKIVGEITGLREVTDEIWLFEVRSVLSGEEILIPVADELITDIDSDHNRLMMDLPEGLADL